MNAHAQISTDEIIRRLNERVEDVVHELYPGATFKGPIAYCGSEGINSSFHVYLSQYKQYSRGEWRRWSESRGGSLLNLICYALTGDHKGTHAYRLAFQWSERFLGLDRARPITPEEIEARERRERDAEDKRARDAAALALQQAGKVEDASGIWREASPLVQTSITYFAYRGLDSTPPISPELRFHAKLWNAEARRCYPAIVALVRSVDGKGKAIWRIYLNEDGSQKAPLGSPKLGLGPAGGGAVRLGGLASKIGIAEGVETALACAELCGNSRPVWAGLSTSGLIGFQCPPEVHDVTIYADADDLSCKGDRIRRPGLEAAEKLKARLLQEGKTCRITLPPLGLDFLDLLGVIKGNERRENCARGDAGEREYSMGVAAEIAA